MVVDMSFTKKVKTGNCKILIITYKFFVNLLLTLTKQPANQLVKITIYLWGNKSVNLLMVYI
jgi:hypothetical protein